MFFDDAADFRAWLEAHHDTATEVWVGLRRKHMPNPGLLYAEAVRVGLCFGWIDSVSQRIDEDSRRQRWTPRRRGSTWSTVNIAAVEELTAAGLMHPAGLAAFAARREDRSGIYTYENDAPVWPEDYEERLRADPRARAFWDAATATYRKHATAWVVTAKQEATRERRLAQLIEDCAAGRLIKPQRYGTEPVWATKARAALDDLT